MVRRTDDPQSPRINIEKILDSANLHICRAAFLVVTMLIKRVLWRSYVEETIQHLDAAKQKLGELDDRSNRS